VDRLINGIVSQLESMGETEVSSEQVGETIMGALKNLDHVAYVRFASVYRNFNEASDFGAIVDELKEKDEGKR
jgi:transcriptional repressor NrdR